MSEIPIGRVVINLRDDWDGQSEYKKLDCVYHRGCAWVAKQDNAAIEPDENNAESRDVWMLIAKPDNPLYYTVVS